MLESVISNFREHIAKLLVARKLRYVMVNYELSLKIHYQILIIVSSLVWTKVSHNCQTFKRDSY